MKSIKKMKVQNPELLKLYHRSIFELRKPQNGSRRSLPVPKRFEVLLKSEVSVLKPYYQRTLHFRAKFLVGGQNRFPLEKRTWKTILFHDRQCANHNQQKLNLMMTTGLLIISTFVIITSGKNALQHIFFIKEITRLCSHWNWKLFFVNAN